MALVSLAPGMKPCPCGPKFFDGGLVKTPLTGHRFSVCHNNSTRQRLKRLLLAPSTCTLHMLGRTGRYRMLRAAPLHAAQCSSCLQAKGVPLASNQVQYSLLYREPERNGVKKAIEDVGATLVAYSPLNQGLLTGTPWRVFVVTQQLIAPSCQSGQPGFQ